MSLIKIVNGAELYVVPNQQFVICADYPDYEEFLPFFDFTTSDISERTSTVNGIQKSIPNKNWTKERQKYMDWLLSIFDDLQVPIRSIAPRPDEYPAWTVNYFEGGWQAGHFHSTNKMAQDNKRFISTVMFFDHIQPTKDNRWNGCLYTILQNEYGYTYDHKFHPSPGRVVILDDRVWHGTYPTEDNRRVFVSDFDID